MDSFCFFWHGAQTLTAGCGSSWPHAMLLTHNSRDLWVGRGKLCGEMERALAVEIKSMSLSLKSWVTSVSPSLSEAVIFTVSPNSESTETFETRTGLTKVRREEMPTFKSGKREKEAKPKMDKQPQGPVLTVGGKSLWVFQSEVSVWGPMRDGGPE